MERRIAAIFAADMAGSSRLMERDEADVLARQKAHFAEVFEPAFAEFRGRVVKGTGDGLIGVFDSVVDAVQCAVRIQREMAAREAGPEDRRIVYRIGVNLGDVIFDDGDVYGDGVNVASRLEGLAELGGVVVSGAVHDMLKAQVEVGYRSLGAVKVKNISMPVRAFHVVDDPAAVGKVARRLPWRLVVVAAVLFAMGLAGGWWLTQPDFEPADPQKMAYLLPEEPTIAVLPFKNLSGEEEHDYLSRSFSEQVITRLTTSPVLVVVEAGAVDVDDSEHRVQAVAEASSVRYVLLGSYLVKGETLQFSARLMDAVDGRQLWADDFQRPLTADAFFEIQKAITDRVALEVNVELTTSTLYRDYRDVEQTLDEMKAMSEANEAFQQWDEAGQARAEALYKKYLVDHPDSAGAHTALAWSYWQRVIVGVAPPKEAFPLAYQHAQKALELNPEFSGAHAVLAWLSTVTRDFDSAEKHVDANLRYAKGVAPSMGGVLLALERVKEAEALARKAMREQPRHHDFVPRILAISLMRQGKLDEARSYYEGILNSDIRDVRLKRQVSTEMVVLAHLEGDFEGRDRYSDPQQRSYNLGHLIDKTMNECRTESEYLYAARLSKSICLSMLISTRP